MKKIIQMTISYAPFWDQGGPPRIMSSYTNGLIKLGYDVSVICSNFQDDSVLGIERTEKGARIKYVQSKGGYLARYYFDFSFFDIWRELKKNDQYNMVVHLAQTRTMFNLVTLIYSYFYKINIAFSPFGSLPNRNIWLLKIFDIFVTKRVVRRAALNFGQTTHELGVLKGFGASDESLKLLPLAYEGLVEQNNTRRNSIRESYGLKDDDIVFLFLGRFHETKGVLNLISSFNNIVASTNTKKVVLWLIGADKGALSDIISLVNKLELNDIITIMSPKFGDERFYFYEAADFFVITPTIYEETSLASIEALSMGTPVITTVRSEVPFLEDYNAGYLEKNELDNITGILTKTLNLSNIDRMLLRENAKKLFNDKFQVDNNVQLLSTFIESI
jgi:glycosyltransferase involved in cell wall biosynthesis